MNPVTEDRAIVWYANKEFSHLPTGEAINASLAFSQGWMRHMWHDLPPGECPDNIEQQARDSCTRLEMPSFCVDAWLRGYSMRGAWLRANKTLR